MSEFAKNAALNTEAYVKKIEGMAYLPWAAAIALSEYAPQVVATFDGRPVLQVFGGAVVAVDMTLPDGKPQRTWLPVLDARNNAIKLEIVTARDISDSIARCKAKAIAMVTGVGMSLFADHGGNGMAWLKDLAVTEGSNLPAVQAIVYTKAGVAKASYVDWASALGAARITDPNFHWEVRMFEGVDKDTGEIARVVPYVRMGGSFMVAVDVSYKGRQHTEWLPIMGIVEVNGKKRDNQPLTKPDCFDWNYAVMRCLTKAIAVISGYGLSAYAKDDLTQLGDNAQQIEEEKQKSTTSALLELIRKTIPDLASPKAVGLAKARIDQLVGEAAISNEDAADLKNRIDRESPGAKQAA